MKGDGLSRRGGDVRGKLEPIVVDEEDDGENKPPGETNDTLVESKSPEDDADAADPALIVPDIFTVSTINSYGNTENQRIRNVPGERLTFNVDREYFLSVNFSDANYTKFYKDINDMVWLMFAHVGALSSCS